MSIRNKKIKRPLKEKSKKIYIKIKNILESGSNFIEKKLARLKISIRYKLLILFVLIALPSLLFAIFTFSLIRDTIHSQTESFQKAVVTSSKKIIEHYVLNCQKTLMSLGSEKNFRQAVKNKNRYSIKQNLKRVFVKYKTFSFLGVVDKERGKVYMVSAYPDRYRSVTRNKQLSEFLKWNFTHPATRLSTVYKINNVNEVIVVYPLRGALLVGGVNLGNLADLLKKIRPVQESSFILIDEERNYILGGNGKFNLAIDTENNFIELNNNKNLGYYVYDSVLKWWIIISSPKNVIYKGIIYLKRVVVGFVVIGISVALILALYFSKMITRPISYLHQGARNLGKGDLGYRIELNTGDELEQLATEFNRMGEELKKSYDSLEVKVKNATIDLKEAYKEIEEKNEELKKADKLKSEFLASMSHELRTPMNAIIGFTALLEDGTYGRTTKKQQRTLKKIKRNTQHLLNLINDILDLSKIEASKMELFPERFELTTLLNELTEEVRPLAEDKGLKLSLNAEDNLKCYHDYTRMRQIAMNLVSNAIKFTSDGKVSIKSGKCSQGFYISVVDTGIGMKKEQLSNIFNEFVQADGSITREFGGTGLGLSISKKLVNLMGGELKVESEWKKGSTFTIVLPFEMSQ
ncbi:MAG: ATP-binding protein [Elusimicrobiota bacterium]